MKNLMMTFSCYALLIVLIVPTTFKSCDEKNGGDEYTYPNALIEMTKTACFGRCPEYTINLDGKGNGLYKGIKNVDKIGNYEKNFSAEEVNGLITAFEKAKFWDFEDEYTAKVTDLPTTYISFTKGSQSKKIKDYYGAPATLKALEKAVEELANSAGWEAASDD